MSPVDPILLLRSLDTLSDVALIYDRLLRLVYANRAASALLKLTESAAFCPHVERAFRTKEQVIVNQELPCGDATLTFESIFTPVPGDNGNPQFVISISRDVTKRAS